MTVLIILTSLFILVQILIMLSIDLTSKRIQIATLSETAILQNALRQIKIGEVSPSI